MPGMPECQNAIEDEPEFSGNSLCSTPRAIPPGGKLIHLRVARLLQYYENTITQHVAIIPGTW